MNGEIPHPSMRMDGSYRISFPENSSNKSAIASIYLAVSVCSSDKCHCHTVVHTIGIADMRHLLHRPEILSLFVQVSAGASLRS